MRLFILLATLVLVYIAVASQNSTQTPDIEASLQTVDVGSIASLSSDTVFTVLGTVASMNQSDIKAETSGQVKTVSVQLGDTVTPGQLLISLENRAQYASLLQAEGAYNAAEVAAQRSDIGVTEAENDLQSATNNALTAYNSAYTTLQNIYTTQLDEIFADPKNTYRSPNFVPADFMQRAGRVDMLYNSIGKNLEKQQTEDARNQTIEAKLLTAQNDTNILRETVVLLRNLISDNDATEALGALEVSYLQTLSTAEQSLNSIENSLQSAESALLTAKEFSKKAELGGTSLELSSANAQLKQALGSLKAAQAMYAKTRIRTPIAGTVNELSVKAGDFISPGQRVALIANNNALEITAYVGEKDRIRLTVGDEVHIEGGSIGIITAVAPAIDSVTKKFEVKIGTESDTITNGDTVRITATFNTIASQNDDVRVPITALQFNDTDASLFTVEGNVLTSHPVEIGDIFGSMVEIRSGVQPDMRIVIDARGLQAGTEVTVREIN